jgi:diadenosine tetraphosphate (Ap4A) HIT family hydrolase/5-methylcytosine-specific restriction endonuclease McrA
LSPHETGASREAAKTQKRVTTSVSIRFLATAADKDVVFDQLKTFIDKSMRMSHIYQPVMLMTLLEMGGKASVREIASSILIHDESQIEYYEAITKEMVGRVLRNRQVARKEGKEFQLLDFERLSGDQVTQLISLCQKKLEDFKERRGARIWQHRKMSEGYISGTIRYEVLKRAKFRCELCGISADVKALEVDHIVPRNKGGGDDISNFQALCYSCNAMKRDRDDTDFRKVIESYQYREPGCAFCEIPGERVIFQNELCFAVADKYPVTPGHMLVIPKRHVPDYFELGRPEQNCVHLLLEQLRQRLKEDDSAVKGFNIGMNCGEVAGQTIFHCHVHIIPRREGDVDDPAGGVRHVMPGKGHYPWDGHK